MVRQMYFCEFDDFFRVEVQFFIVVQYCVYVFNLDSVYWFIKYVLFFVGVRGNGFRSDEGGENFICFVVIREGRVVGVREVRQ